MKTWEKLLEILSTTDILARLPDAPCLWDERTFKSPTGWGVVAAYSGGRFQFIVRMYPANSTALDLWSKHLDGAEGINRLRNFRP